jgi:hypothetical protein
MIAETHMKRGAMPIRTILDKTATTAAEGGANHRHRGRQQPAGAEDRAAGGVMLTEKQKG